MEIFTVPVLTRVRSFIYIFWLLLLSLLASSHSFHWNFALFIIWRFKNVTFCFELYFGVLNDQARKFIILKPECITVRDNHEIIFAEIPQVIREFNLDPRLISFNRKPQTAGSILRLEVTSFRFTWEYA